MGPLVVEALAEQIHDAGALVDVHLMVERPERHIADFAKAGADGITVHVEATPHVHYALQAVHDAGCRAGLALCPGTPVDASRPSCSSDIDLVLCMTVNPGWGGQAFLPGSLGKIERLRGAARPGRGDRGRRRHRRARPPARAPQRARPLFVAGSAVFGAPDPAAGLPRDRGRGRRLPSGGAASRIGGHLARASQTCDTWATRS